MNKFLHIALLLITFLVSLSCESKNLNTQSAQTPKLTPPAPQEQNRGEKQNPNIELGFPRDTSGHAEIILSRKQYVISWNYQTRNPNWAAWKLQVEDFGKAERSSFKVDPDLKNYLADQQLTEAVSTKEYTGSCFDRGHTVPSADRNSSPEDNQPTFYMSNITPQTSFLNQRAWAHLENYERDLVRGGKILYIYSGPIYETDRGAIGTNSDIKIPSKFFKIIVASESGKKDELIAVIMPNKTSADTWPDEDRKTLCDDSKRLPSGLSKLDDWEDYQTTLEDVEAQSGFKFLEKDFNNITAPVIISL